MSETSEPLRVGIAGYGVVGRRRRQFIDQNPALTVVAVSDIRFPEVGTMDDGVAFYPQYRELLDHDLDVLFVSLPNHLAADACIRGLQRGLHVFCEKPPGRNMQDIRDVRLVEAAHPGLKLMYGFNHRYHESVKRARKIIESREFGAVINVRGVYGKSSVIPFTGGWRSERALAGGGILLDQGIHMLDMIRYFCGDFDEIKSFVSNSCWRHDVEDNAYAIMRNKAGVVAMVHSTATQWRHKFRLEVTLERALLELTGILSSSKSYGEEKLTIMPRDEGSAVGTFAEITTSYLEDPSWREEVDTFASVVADDLPVVSGTSADAEKVMELVFRIYCADETWRDTFEITL